MSVSVNRIKLKINKLRRTRTQEEVFSTKKKPPPQDKSKKQLKKKQLKKKDRNRLPILIKVN